MKVDLDKCLLKGGEFQGEGVKKVMKCFKG